MLLPLLFLIVTTFNLCCSSLHNNEANGQERNDLQRYIDNKIERFRVDLHRSFQQRHQRIRRSLEDAEDLVFELEGLLPLVADRVSVVEHFFIDGTLYIITGVTQAADGSFDSTAKIYKFKDAVNFFEATGSTFPTTGLSDIETFQIGGHMYIAVANQRSGPNQYNTLSNIYRFNPVSGRVHNVQQIFTHGAADFSFFMFEGDVYLALANMRDDAYAKYRSLMSIYVFDGAHFDQVTSVETFGATDIAIMEMEWELYIVVAQYIDNDGRYDIGSIVYKFNPRTDTLDQVQRLPSSAPKDVTPFMYNGNHYLAIANYQEVDSEGVFHSQTDSVIYWWTGTSFVEFQRISTVGARQWEEVELPNGEIILVLSSAQGVLIYEFSLDAEWVLAHSQFVDVPANDDIATLDGAVLEAIDTGSSILMMVIDTNKEIGDYNFNGSTNIFKFVITEALPYTDSVSPVVQCIRDVTNSTQDLAELIDSLEAKVDEALMTDGEPQEVIGQVEFISNYTIDDTLKIKNLTLTGEYLYNLSEDFLNNTLRINETIELLRPIMDDIVLISKEQSVASHLVFEQAVLSTDTTANSTLSTTGMINAVDIDLLNDTVVWLVGDQLITGQANLTEDMTIQSGDLTIAGFVNGHLIPDDIMTLNGTETALGYSTFTNATVFEASLTVDGTVNSLNLLTDVVTTHLDHTVGGLKTVSIDLMLDQGASIASLKTVDTVDLSELRLNAVSLTDGGTAAGTITFLGDVTIDGQLHTDIVDGINVTELNNQAVIEDTIQTIAGTKSIDSVVLLSNLNVSGDFNGHPVSEFVRVDIPGGPISTSVKFAKGLTLEDLYVTGPLNGLDIPNDIVLEDGDQTVTETVTFNQDIVVIGNITFEENATLAAVDISELPKTTVSTTSLTQQILSQQKTFTDNVQVQGNITAQLINGVNLTELQRQILSLSRPQVINQPVQVEGQLVIKGDLELVNDTFDGHHLSEDLVRLDTISTLHGHHTFRDFVEINGDLDLVPNATISGVDLNELDRTVIKLIGNQTIPVDVRVTGDASMLEDLNIDGLVNGLDISEDAVTLYGLQNINGSIHFEAVDISGDVVTSTLNADTINTVNVDELYSDAVMCKGSPATILTPVVFLAFDVHGALVVNGTVDEVDVQELAMYVVTLSGNQTINGSWESTSDVKFTQHLSVERNVVGIPFNQFIESVILKDTNSMISGMKNFTGSVTVDGNVTVNDLVNGIDIEELNRIYLSLTRNQTLHGLKTFTNNISVDNILLEPGVSINDIIPSIDLVPTNSAGGTIYGSLLFLDYFEVNGNLTIGGTINNIDLNELYNSVVWLDASAQQLSGSYSFDGGLHINGNISMLADMEVNGVDISELADRLVQTGQNQTIEIPTTFTGPVVVDGNVETEGLMGEVDLKFILTDAVLSGPAQVIAGDKFFSTILATQHLDVETNVITDVVSGPVSLKHLLDNAVMKSTNQSVHGAFNLSNIIIQENLIIYGLTGGIDLSTQAILQHTAQTLTQTNTFTNGFNVDGNITVGSLVDTVDIPALVSNLVMVDTYQVISGTWTFANNVSVLDNITIAGTVNDFDISEDLVTRFRVHNITGSKSFTDSVTFSGDLIVPLVNGVDLVLFQDDIVHLDGPYTIIGNKVFSGNVSFLGNVTVTGLVNRIDVEGMFYDHLDIAERLDRNLNDINDSLTGMCGPINSLQIAVKGQAIQLSHWEFDDDFQPINNTRTTHSYASLHIDAALLILLLESSEAYTTGCISTRMYMCASTEDGRSCIDMFNSTTLKAASSGELFPFDDDIFVTLALSDQSSTCTDIVAAANEVQVLKMNDSSFDERLPAEHAVDTAMFEIDGVLYLAEANLFNHITGDPNTQSRIFEFNSTTQKFSELQTIMTAGASAVTYLKHGSLHWLTYICSYDTTYSFILLWNAEKHQFEVDASILTHGGSDVLGMIVADIPTIIIANKKKVDEHGFVDLNQPIYVYNYYNGSGWLYIQAIDAVGIVQLSTFSINYKQYLVGVSSLGSVHIYEWSGASAFEEYMSIATNDVATVHPFILWGGLHMAMARPSYGSDITDYSGAFVKAIIRGILEYTVLEA